MADEQENQINQLKAVIEGLSEQLEMLSKRVESLETQPEVQPNPLASPSPIQPQTSAPKPSLPSSLPSSLLAQRQAAGPAKQNTHAQSNAPVRPMMSPVQGPKKPKPTKPKKSFDPAKLEQFLGIRGLAIVGMLIVVVGVGFFLKLAVDEGWIAKIPPSVRCWISGGFGAVLVGIGELVRRKINPIASSGISAAGIATIYASILAAAKLFDLIDTPMAFVLMAMVTVLGILLGSLSNRVMLAALSLVGAFAVPILLSTGKPSYVVLPMYLIMLLVLGLALSAWRGGSYGRVRQLAWWGTGGIGSFWLVDMYDRSPTSAIVFVSVVWLATVLELVASARFFGRLRDSTPWPTASRAGIRIGANNEKHFDPMFLLSRETRWITALFGATIWAVVASSMTLWHIDPKLDFVGPLSFGLGSALVGGLQIYQGGWKRRKKFARMPEPIFSDVGSPRSALVSATIINAMMLGVATIFTALGGWVQVGAWALIGLGAIETARRIRFRSLGLFGFGLLAVAIARLLGFDSLAHADDHTPKIILGLAFTLWSVQLVFVAGVAAVVAWRSRYRIEGSVAGCAVIWLLGLSMLHPDAEFVPLGTALMLIAGIGAWVSVKTPKIQSLRINTYVLIGIGMAALLIGQVELNEYMAGIQTIDIAVIELLIAAGVWVAMAKLPRANYTARLIFATMAILSGLMALAKVQETMGDPQAIFFIALAISLLVAFELRLHRLHRWSITEICSCLIVLVISVWGMYEINLGEAIFDARSMLSWDFAAALISVAIACWIGRSITKLPEPDDAPTGLAKFRASASNVMFGVAWLTLLAATSLEVVRTTGQFFEKGSAGGAAVSVWWSLFAIASVAIGFRGKAPLRWAGLALLGIVAIKVLLFDTVMLDQVARIIASISVGLVIIAAGALYAWLTGAIAKVPKESVEAPEPDHIPED